jgi:hypothetical protein
MQIPIPQCAGCLHFDPTRWECAAFKGNGIPAAILTGEHDHRFPYPGDHGIRYEPTSRTGEETTNEP